MTKTVHQEDIGLKQPLLSHDEEELAGSNNNDHHLSSPPAPPLVEAVPVVEAAAARILTEAEQQQGEQEEVATPDHHHQQQHNSTTFPPHLNVIHRTPSLRRGQWKDGIFNCCTHGCCHPSLVYPLCCPLIGIGQVMGRLDLNLAGRRGTKLQSTLTFTLLCTVAIFVFYFGSPQKNQQWMNVLLPSSLLTLFLFYLIVATRRYIRKRDNIAPRCCGSCDDCCAAAFFPCCAISQMMRHTADYSVYRAVWLSKTGLPDGVVERFVRDILQLMLCDKDILDIL